MKLLSLWAGLILLLAGASASQGGDRANDNGSDFIFLAESRPILVRLRIELDGKPLAEVWDAFAQHVFRSLDKNGDGVLDVKELRQMPPPQAILSGNIAPKVDGTAQSIAGPDGKASLDDLKKYLRRSGIAPLQARFGSANPAIASPRFAGQPAMPATKSLQDSLLKLLDTNKDGKLSREELARAPAVLMQRDADDDEIITAAELLQANVGIYGETSYEPEAKTAKTTEEPFVLLTPEESPRNLARRLLARYGAEAPAPANKKLATPASKGSLTRQQLRLDEETFKFLDADEDGRLDMEELAHFARRPADVEFSIRLGTAGKNSVTITPRPGMPASLATEVKKAANGDLVLRMASMRFDLRAEPTPARGKANSNRQAYLAQFKQADQDNNGYIDQTEARRNYLFQSLFSYIDQDGDGKIFEKEFIAYIDKIEDLQNKARSSMVLMEISNQARTLFDVLDANGDGRLSLREMRNAVQLIESMDADGDGQLSMSEFPRSYLLRLNQGPQITPQRPVPGTPQPTMPAQTAGPLWFQKMDRNRDRDLSPREFLGSAKDFALIDADGDGLISAEEADRADAALRAGQPLGKMLRVIAGWGSVVDPDGDCTITEQKGKLTIAVPDTLHNLNPSIASNAPRVLREVEGDFRATVKVTGDFKPGDKATKPRGHPFNGAGLLVWHDEKNCVRLERNIWWMAAQSKHACYPPLLEYYKDGVEQGVNMPGTTNEFFKGRSTYLRLERTGNKLLASYSHDGQHWTVVKEIAVDLPAKVHVGVAAVNSSNKPFLVEFEQFKIERQSGPQLNFLAFDGFDGKFGLNWQPVRHDPTHISLAKNPGKLTITTQQGTIHRDEKARGEPSAKNIFTIDNPLDKEADFVMTTCITGFQPTMPYQQAGLVCYDDDDNYLRWSIMFNYPKGEGVTFSFIRETTGESMIIHVPAPQDAKAIWLRITKRGNSYEYASSTDGKTFNVHGSGVWSKNGPAKVGILAKNGGQDGVPEMDACFDFFDFRSRGAVPPGGVKRER